MIKIIYICSRAWIISKKGDESMDKDCTNSFIYVHLPMLEDPFSLKELIG